MRTIPIRIDASCQRFTAALAATAALLCASAACAQADDDALIHQGVELRKQGQNAEALAAFQRADAAHPSPRAKAQIALAEQALGRWVEAEVGLLAVLDLDVENDPWIERNREPLESALATIRDHLGTLEIESNVEGATIVVNGTPVGTSPLPSAVRVVAGTAQIEVQAQGYGPMQRAIDVPPRSSVKAAIVVMPLVRGGDVGSAALPVSPSNVNEAGASGQGANAAQESAAQASVRSSAPAPSDGASTTRRAGWIALIAAAPLLATGVTAHVVREHNAAQYNDDARCFMGVQTRDQRCGNLRDTANTATVIAAIGYGTGAAALITGVTLLLAGARGTASEDRARVSAQLDPHTAYVTCDLDF
jgi:hypothetical protein